MKNEITPERLAEEICQTEALHRRIAKVFGHCLEGKGYRIGKFFFKNAVHIRYDADQYIQGRMMDFMSINGFDYLLVSTRVGDAQSVFITIKLGQEEIIKASAQDRRLAWYIVFQRFTQIMETYDSKSNLDKHE